MDQIPYIWPHVIEKDGRIERSYDVFSRLLKDRIIFLGTPIDDFVGDLVVAQLLFLEKESPKQDVDFFINCPGGIVTAGLAIYDVMQYISCEVATYCVGQAASMGAVLLASGAAGKRYGLPHSRVLIHQPWGGIQGSASDISIQAEELIRIKKRINEILAKHTGKSLEQIEKDTDRDKYMTAEEAKQYGLVDDVLESAPKKPEGG